MKIFGILSFLLILQTGNTIIGVVDDVLIFIDAASLIKTVFSAVAESSNFTEFLQNLDQQEKHQKLVEAKLDEIQTTIAQIKKTILQFSADLKRLEFSVDIKHFNSHIKYRTKQIFHSVQRFFEHPSNSTRQSLIMQCHINPPNSILEVLHDILSENWLIDQSRHFHFESSALADLIKKLDKIVEILAISEAACAGMNTMEDAKYDFKKLAENLKQIHYEINRSKDVIHKTYFNYTRTVVKDYLSRYAKFHGRNLTLDLLEHFQTKYNYGPLYTVGLLAYYNLLEGTITDEMIYGNLQKEFSYIEKFNNKSIVVIQSPSICHFHTVSGKMFLDSLIEPCSINNSLTELYLNKCGINYSCGYVPTLSCFTGFHRYYSIFASNGGICGYGENHVQAIVVKPMPNNFVYKPLKIRRKFLFNSYYFREVNETHVYRQPVIEKAHPVIFDPVEYIEEKLFMEHDFTEILSKKVLQVSDPPIISNISQPPESYHPVLTSKGGNKDEYSNFDQGYDYIFYGKAVCKNGNFIGKDATVNLIEVDTFSFDDTVTSSKIDREGYFTLRVSSNYNDFPSEVLEFKLEFENCCGLWDRYCGFLINGTLCEYTVA